MTKKVEQPAIRGASYMTGYPNPRALGLKGPWWRKVQGFVDELNDLHQREHGLQQRKSELTQELNHQKRRLSEEFAAAARANEKDPDDKYLRLTEKELEKIQRRMDGIDRARQLVEADLRQVVEVVPEEVIAERRERGRELEARYLELVQQAQAVRDELGTVYSVHSLARETQTVPGEGPREKFTALPLPDHQGRPWYERPLDWGEQPEESEPPKTAAVTTVSG